METMKIGWYGVDMGLYSIAIAISHEKAVVEVPSILCRYKSRDVHSTTKIPAPLYQGINEACCQW